MYFPTSLEDRPGIEVVHLDPDRTLLAEIEGAAEYDSRDPGFIDAVQSIPAREELYTWRVTNADADLGRGDSLSLGPDEEVLAHAWTLNKFLIAAESHRAVPVTRKGYIHTRSCFSVSTRSY